MPGEAAAGFISPSLPMSRPPACLPSPPALLPPSPFSYRCSLVPLLLLTQSWVVHLSTRPQHPLLGNFPAIRERKMFCRFGGQICLRNLGELCPQSFLGSSQLASGCRKGGGACLWGQPLGASASQGPSLLYSANSHLALPLCHPVLTSVSGIR